jgi:hypothetical protein
VSDLGKAIVLAKKIEERAGLIAASVKREIAIRCGDHPEFEVIMLEAVERKIAELRHSAQLQAAGVRT